MGYYFIDGVDYTAIEAERMAFKAEQLAEYLASQKECDHSWVAGFMVVHPEDLDAIAAMRPVICSWCDKIYC